MDVQAVTAAISGFKTVIDIAKSIAAISKDAEVNTKVIDLQTVILEVQGNLLSMQNDYSRLLQEKQTLEQSLADKQAWEDAKRRYELRQLGENTYAYALRGEFQQEEPAHLLCPNCFSNEHKSILQMHHRQGPEQYFHCHACKMLLTVRHPGMA